MSSTISYASYTVDSHYISIDFRFDYEGDILNTTGVYKVRVWLREESGGSDDSPDDRPTGDGWTLEPSTTTIKYCTVDFSGLDASTTYRYRATVIYYDSEAWINTDVTCTGTITTVGQQELPLWSWTAEEGSYNYLYGDASAEQLSAGKTAAENGGLTHDYHHLIWNDLIGWVIATTFRVTGDRPSTTARMTDDDTTLTADRFNEFADLVDDCMTALGSSMQTNRATSGDQVDGDRFGGTDRGLVYWINYAIENFNASLE